MEDIFIIMKPPYGFLWSGENPSHHLKNPHMLSGIKAYYLSKYTLFKKNMSGDDADLFTNTRYKG